MITAEKIYNRLISKPNISDLADHINDTCIWDKNNLLQFLEQQPEQFINLCRWQFAFLDAINRKQELAQLLEELMLCKDELEAGQISLINQAFQIINTAEVFLSGNADDLIQFHSCLFSTIDKTAEMQFAEKAKSDLAYSIQFFDRAKQEQSSVHLDFIFWQQHLLQSLGFDKSSHIRFLIIIKLFHKDTYATLIDEGVQGLLQSFKNKEPVNTALTIDELTEALADYHINLFQYIDDAAAPKFRSQTLQDAKKNFEFLKEAAGLKSTELFVNYTEWLYSVLSSLGIPKISLIRFLVSMRYIIQTKGGEPWQAATEYLDSAITHLACKEDSYLQHDSTITEDASAYLQLLLAGKRKEAHQMIFNLIKNGMPVRDIYLHIFQSSQYEVGRLWERNMITVAQEHFCTASTQLIMSQLYPFIVSGPSTGKNVVVSCIGNELHEIGIRIITDFLEMEGWQTYYLGANSPATAILSAIEQNKAQVLALSVTLSPHLKQARTLIETIRNNTAWPVKIIVGGYPFKQDKELWKKIGADAYAESAETVHQQLSALFN